MSSQELRQVKNLSYLLGRALVDRRWQVAGRICFWLARRDRHHAPAWWRLRGYCLREGHDLPVKYEDERLILEEYMGMPRAERQRFIRNVRGTGARVVEHLSGYSIDINL